MEQFCQLPLVGPKKLKESLAVIAEKYSALLSVEQFGLHFSAHLNDKNALLEGPCIATSIRTENIASSIKR